jgi:glycosyltransferase involved in cell wall biosynthesis
VVSISVCMATRNGGRYLRQQLQTILTQLGPEDELVISDDSSEDDTVRIIRSFGDPRIRLMEGNTFFSPIFNFENSLKQAKGDVVVLSDQDDLWLEDRLTTIRSLFSTSALRRLVVLDAAVIDEKGEILHGSLFDKIHAGPGLLKNIFNNTYVGCCMAFSRDLLELALPFPRKIPMHDMWLGTLAGLFGKVEFVRKTSMMYRRHGATMTDFRIRFAPVLQIKRRVNLVLSLAQRAFHIKFGRREFRTE